MLFIRYFRNFHSERYDYRPDQSGWQQRIVSGEFHHVGFRKPFVFGKKLIACKAIGPQVDNRYFQRVFARFDQFRDLVILDRFSIFAEKTKWNVLNVNQNIK
jgi:hypothetical protein